MEALVVIIVSPQGWGYILLIAGCYIRYAIGKRKFNRRGVGGLQHFSSYGKAIVITLLETLFKGMAIAFMFLGILMIIKSGL